jgi:hypothetical protein
MRKKTATVKAPGTMLGRRNVSLVVPTALIHKRIKTKYVGKWL